MSSAPSGVRGQGRSEFGVALFLGGLGVLVIVQALLLEESLIARGPVGPRRGRRTIAMLAAAFVANALLIEPLGWPVSGAILFWGSAFALGSRHPVRDLVIAVVLSVGTWYLFVLGLGIALPVGILEGIL